MIYALREALKIVREEGLEQRWRRHEKNSLVLIKEIENIGLQMFIPENRAPTLNSVSIPSSVPDAKVRKTLLDHFNIEIGGGLGPLKGKTWRIGLMGQNSNRRNVNLLLDALKKILKK